MHFSASFAAPAVTVSGNRTKTKKRETPTPPDSTLRRAVLRLRSVSISLFVVGPGQQCCPSSRWMVSECGVFETCVEVASAFSSDCCAIAMSVVFLFYASVL